MIQEILNHPDFLKGAALGEQGKDAEGVYVGLMDGFKTAGLDPGQALLILDWVMSHSTLEKQAGAADWIWNNGGKAIYDRLPRSIQRPLGAAGAAIAHPQVYDKVEGAVKSPIGQKLIAGDWGGALQEGFGAVGDKLKGFYNWATSPDITKQWAPYAASGLASMLGAKALGAGTMGTLAAGAAGGMMGGRVLTGKPAIPQTMKDTASGLLQSAKNKFLPPPGAVTSNQQSLQQNHDLAASQIRR